MRDATERTIYVSPWRIDATIRAGIVAPVRIAALARALAIALDAVGAPAPSSIGLILADDAELAELNAEHLGHEGPTDVLSFPLLAPQAFPPHPGGPPRGSSRAAAEPESARPPGMRPHLGDIVVSVERAIDQAIAGRGGQTGDVRWSPADELRLLVTHGALHICGWDHADPAEERAMRALEQRLLADAR